jgi:hypothetical protein
MGGDGLASGSGDLFRKIIKKKPYKFDIASIIIPNSCNVLSLNL